MKKYYISKATVFRVKGSANSVLLAVSNANRRSKRNTIHTAKFNTIDDHLYKGLTTGERSNIGLNDYHTSRITP